MNVQCYLWCTSNTHPSLAVHTVCVYQPSRICRASRGEFCLSAGHRDQDGTTYHVWRRRTLSKSFPSVRLRDPFSPFFTPLFPRPISYRRVITRREHGTLHPSVISVRYRNKETSLSEFLLSNHREMILSDRGLRAMSCRNSQGKQLRVQGVTGEEDARRRKKKKVALGQPTRSVAFSNDQAVTSRCG